jgi:hypothetical protein
MTAADGDFLARSASGPTNAFLQHCWVHTAAVAFVTNHMGWMPSILADLASPVDEDAGLLGDWDSLPPAPPRAAKRGRLTEEGAHASQLASPARAARRTCVLGVQPPLLQHVALTVFLGELAQLPMGPLCGLALVAAELSPTCYDSEADREAHVVTARLVSLLCSALYADCHESLCADEALRLLHASSRLAAPFPHCGPERITTPILYGRFSWECAAHARPAPSTLQSDASSADAVTVEAAANAGGARAGATTTGHVGKFSKAVVDCDGAAANAPRHSAAAAKRDPTASEKDDADLLRRCEAIRHNIEALRSGHGVTARQQNTTADGAVALLREQADALGGDTHVASDSAVGDLCAMMGLSAAGGSPASSDELLSLVCARFVTSGLSRHVLLSFISAVFLPRIHALVAPAPRVLMTAITHVVKLRPEVISDAILLPMLCTRRNPVSSAQCELAIRLVKELPADRLDGVLHGLCAFDANSNGGVGGWPHAERTHCEWNDLTMPVVTAVIGKRIPLSERTTTTLINRLQHASESASMLKSQKFALVMHSLITRYPGSCVTSTNVLQGILERCTSFMAKPALAALARCARSV